MDETENRPIQDPSADTCFLGGSIDELPPIEPSSAMQDIDASNPPTVLSGQVVDFTGAAPVVMRVKNPVATETMNRAIPTLPSGEEIDSKNTLQSFHVIANSGNDCDELSVVRSTLSPSFEVNFASNHPTLPSGEIIDSKNTLQSFRTRATIPLTNREQSDTDNMTVSNLLPNAYPAVAWIPQSQASIHEVPAAENIHLAELVTTTEPRRYTAIFWMAFGIFAVVAASVIAGVCFSGNCGSNASDDPLNPEVENAISAFVNDINFFEQDIFANGTSAESQALKWLVRDNFFLNASSLKTLNSQIDNDVSFHVHQRYPLLVLWFQQFDINGKLVNKWTDRSGWLQVESECDWFGITCDSNGSVTEILFYNYETDVANGYVGSIPPDIGLLTSLRNFSMRSNDVTGTIPDSIGNCSQMYLFDIRGNSVTGTLPSFWSIWTYLHYLDVTRNELTVDSLLESVVSTFVNNITYLDQEVLVNGTSAESRALTWLIQADSLFASNRSALMALDSQIDNEVGFRVRQRYALATLWFQQVDEEGIFIKTWETITVWLSTNECEWFGISCDANLYVTEISFYNYDTDVSNNYVGSIPPDIGLLTSLEWFSMRNNVVTGSIPESIGHCSRMKLFDVSGGIVVGTIPSSLGQWTEISIFDLSNNAIFGTVPESASVWTSLVSFSVFENRLSGSIPSFLGQWRNLELLDFSTNMLTNTIPDGVGKLVNMTVLGTSYNRLMGTLPSSLGKLTALTAFYVQENSLTGTIPPSIGNWSQIKVASFEMNDFMGTMPPEICANIRAGDSLSSDCQVNCTCCTVSCTN
jgi:Leucine-rich repeat (LRR) protein